MSGTGAVTAAQTLTVSAGGGSIAGGLTVTNTGLTVTTGGVTIGATGLKVAGGATVDDVGLTVTAGGATVSAGNVVVSDGTTSTTCDGPSDVALTSESAHATFQGTSLLLKTARGRTLLTS